MKQGWEVKKLGDVCELYQPKTISSKEMVDDGKYPVFGANGIIGKYDKYNHEEPQLLITCRGATCGTINISEPKSWINGNAMVVRPKDNSLSLKFIEYLFLGGIDISKTITGAAQPQITRQTLSPVLISYPSSIQEQQRIVAILDEAFAAIAKVKANNEQNLKNAKELFESYLQGVFENKGEDWEEKSLSEICFKITDGSHNPPKGIDFSEYLMISSKNVNNDFIDLDSPRYLKKEDFISENKRTEVIEGDVLLTIVGTIGRVAVVTNEHKYFTLQRSVAVLKPNKDIISSRFLMFSLRNIFEELNENARGVAQKGLYLNQIRSIEISIPKLKTQQIIVEKIDYLLTETKKLEDIYQNKINDLEELKKSVLQKAFSGELKTAKVLV